VPAISAASILAKTCRDALLNDLDALHPGYGFAHNKGYATRSTWLRSIALGHAPCIVAALRQSPRSRYVLEPSHN
jgi:ribonuclease HII